MAGDRRLVTLRRLLGQTRRYRPSVEALFLLSLLASPLELLTPLPLKIVVDSAIGSHPLPRLVDRVPEAVSRSPAALASFAVVLLVAVVLVSRLLALWRTLLRARLTGRLILDFRGRLFRQVRRVSGASFSLSSIQHDVPAIPRVLTESFIPLIVSAVTLLGMIYVTDRIDRPLALIALGISPGLFVTSRAFRGRLRRRSPQAEKLESSELSIVHDALGALRAVKRFGREGREARLHARRSGQRMRTRARLATTKATLDLLVGLITAGGAAVLILVGVQHVRAGTLTLGCMLLVMSYLNQLYRPVRTISQKAASLGPELARAGRVLALLDRRPEVEERPDALPLALARGAITFHHVSFASGEGRPLLQDVSFEIGPRARVGIMGASGAVADALNALLTRLRDPTEGEIRLDGVDLRRYRVADLRRQFAVVPRDPVLFPGTIAENIALASPVGRDELIAAAQGANAHEFIVQLPRGYDTRVGRGGVELSSGQRRLMAIAAAFIDDAPVVIVDDRASDVDPETEAALRGAIRRLARGRTSILITHRESLLERCDEVIALEHGRIVAETARAARGAPPVSSTGSSRGPNLASHPAARAWSRLHPDAEPLGIEPLKVRQHKNMIYRLAGAGPSGAPVIAKRCPREVARLERTVYEEILPRFGVPSLRQYGYLEEPEGLYCWLFMEEANGISYSNLIPEHRAHAARWLGLLHSGLATDTAAGRALPDAGPARYLGVLQSIREAMQRHLDNPILSEGDLGFLQAMQSRFDDLAAHWSRLEDICDAAPRTLVHGDFNGKNIRLRSVNGESTLLVFDWENAGWGVPAVDLAQLSVQSRRLAANPDLATYGSLVRERWPELPPAAWERLAYCGTVFRTLCALSWDMESLATDWAHQYVGNMHMYAEELENALERLGWVGRAPWREVVGA